jgi:Tat protein secretion system quality control protein TatD with DNase activity
MIKHAALEPEQKALEINLDAKIYGTFAEIGAGQEVARYFFQAGAAAGTIAKTMSAYDKVYSDEIYGPEPSGRYVCETRLYKMLDHEYGLLVQRLEKHRPNTCFFAFADTVAAINFTRTIKGDGWLGVRFQTDPNGEPNDLVIHVKMLDGDNRLQQQAVGILGVNLIYAVFRYQKNYEELLLSLMDNLRGRVHIDMIRLTGPGFAHIDNRLLSLKLVEFEMTDVAMFGPDGKNLHASELLYKKYALVVRGSFRPVTLVNQDMMRTSFDQYRSEKEVEASKVVMLTEITLDNLKSHGELDEKDFIDRVELLCAMGQTVMVTNCEQHQRLIQYLEDYRVKQLTMVVGVKVLLDMINAKYYKHMDGSLLSAFGELFTNHVKFYVYPALQEGSSELMTAQNLPIPEGIKFLYKHLLDSAQIVDIKNPHPEILHIYSQDVLEMIQSDTLGWQNMVPSKIASIIRDKCLFGFPYQQLEFEY